MKIGYARVSTDEQNLDLQLDALRAAGCDQIFKDQGISGAKNPHLRPGFAAAVAALNPDDTFVVWKLDRVGRSLGALCALLGEFHSHYVQFQSLTDGIDTSTAGGKLVFHIMGALAEFERDLIRERTKAGMKAAKKRGKHLGRPGALTRQQILHARDLLADGKSQREVAALFGVAGTTIARQVRRLG